MCPPGTQRVKLTDPRGIKLPVNHGGLHGLLVYRRLVVAIKVMADENDRQCTESTFFVVTETNSGDRT